MSILSNPVQYSVSDLQDSILDSAPPSETDAAWWAAQHASDDSPSDDDEDWSDYAAWLDLFHDLPWDYYPGPGNWSETSPCHPGPERGGR
jgi:hypothetical protein